VSTYAYLHVATGNCVHFVDDCWSADELAEVRSEADRKGIKVVYVDCAEYLDRLLEITDSIGFAAGTSNPPYAKSRMPWVRWLDDLHSLGEHPNLRGLAIVLDNAHLVFERDRKFMTTLLESFLHGMRSWLKADKPYHLHFQMVPCASIRHVFAREAHDA